MRSTTKTNPNEALETTDPVGMIAASAAANSLRKHIEQGNGVLLRGAAGSSTSLLAGALARTSGSAILLVTAHLDDADEAVDELTGLGADALRFPALESLPGETHASLELFAERLRALRRIQDAAAGEGRAPLVIAAPIHALMQALPPQDRLDRAMLDLRPGVDYDHADLVRWLDEAGFRRVDAIEDPGEFAVRGGILDIFPAGGGEPVRLDFFGDELERITEVDLDTMGSDRRLDEVEIIGARADLASLDAEGPALADVIPGRWTVLLAEPTEITEQARGYYERAAAAGVIGPPETLRRLGERSAAMIEAGQFAGAGEAARVDLPVAQLPPFSSDAGEAVGELGDLARDHRVVVFCQNPAERARLGELVEEFAHGASIESDVAYLHRGFIWRPQGEQPVALVPHHELLHRFHTRRRGARVRPGRAMDAFVDLEPGDYAVHADHGVAIYRGLNTVKRTIPGTRGETVEEECLTLEFDGGSRLHAPVSQIDKVQKYIGGFRGKPSLSTLGGKKWGRQKEQVGEAVRDLAAEMLRIQAARASAPGIRYPGDTAWQNEFEAEFPYEETEDQLAALAEIKKDMQSPRPADRLLCGDVGYGKTELAIRAAFKAAEYGKQVAVLVPTTVLAEQHERTFRERFADYPFRVESISRFKSAGDQRAVLRDVAQGKVDIIVGTHRLLSRDVRFADLGLVVIDEEQRFGVEHKQTLLSLRMTVDVLTLSATPIPRTLHMALLGIRDISSLATPPSDRRSVVTEVIPFNEERIRRALAREMNRGGQVFFVHNRVKSIHRVADKVRELAPDARIVVGHGQMPAKELEQVMLKFLRREADILVCTTIIESGIDIPTANTMVITNADRFGLADLHQLRGRVGRYKHRAYCYLLLPEERPVTEVAMRRLKAIEEFSMLGAGFKIAMRDLEIRGAGNLLGPEQSGHIAAVGYEMYCRLLEDAVRDLKEGPEAPAPAPDVALDIGVFGGLPKGYIPSDRRRLEAYRRIATARTLDELRAVERDLTEAYGEPPTGARRLLDLAEVRIGAQSLGVRSIRRDEQDVVFRCADPTPVQAALEGVQGTVRALPPRRPGDDDEVYFRPPESWLEPDSLTTVLRRRLNAELATAPT